MEKLIFLSRLNWVPNGARNSFPVNTRHILDLSQRNRGDISSEKSSKFLKWENSCWFWKLYPKKRQVELDASSAGTAPDWEENKIGPQFRGKVELEALVLAFWCTTGIDTYLLAKYERFGG